MLSKIVSSVFLVGIMLGLSANAQDLGQLGSNTNMEQLLSSFNATLDPKITEALSKVNISGLLQTVGNLDPKQMEDALKNLNLGQTLNLTNAQMANMVQGLKGTLGNFLNATMQGLQNIASSIKNGGGNLGNLMNNLAGNLANLGKGGNVGQSASNAGGNGGNLMGILTGAFGGKGGQQQGQTGFSGGFGASNSGSSMLAQG